MKRYLSNFKFGFTLSVSWQVIYSEDMIYVYEHKNKKEFYLENVAKEVWLLIDKGEPVSSIIRTLCALYDIETEILEEDIDELLSNLVLKNLIEVKR